MKKFLQTATLVVLPSCAALDGALGIGGPEGSEEAQIAAIESGARTAGDLVVPGAGGVVALLVGWGARRYVKRRKASKIPPAEVISG